MLANYAYAPVFETTLLPFYLLIDWFSFKGATARFRVNFIAAQVVRLSRVVARTVGSLPAAAQDVAPC